MGLWTRARGVDWLGVCVVRVRTKHAECVSVLRRALGHNGVVQV